MKKLEQISALMFSETSNDTYANEASSNKYCNHLQKRNVDLHESRLELVMFHVAESHQTFLSVSDL